MKRIDGIGFLALILALCGCATTTSSKAPQQTVDASVLQQYQAKINSLEMELNRTKDENYALRRQLEGISKQEVRMPDATEIQTALKKAGFFKGVIDGKIGPETKEAIRKFQEAHGITPDGVVGSKTWSLLSKYISG